MKSFFTLTALALSCICFAQSSFKPGFIITNTGDTTRGYLKQDEENNLSYEIVFKNNSADANSKTLSVSDIVSFGFENENIFQRISYTNPFDSNHVMRFAKLLLTGHYDLFSFTEKGQKLFLLTGTNDSSYLLYDDEITNNGELSQSGNYKNQLFFLSRNCDNLKNTVTALSFTDAKIIDYVKSMNSCIEPSSGSNIVYKKEKAEKIIYAYAGGISIGKEYEITGRVIARFTIPAIDKKSSFNVGINYMRLYEQNVQTISYQRTITEKITHEIISIPLTLQYNFTRGIIRPYCDGGVSLDYLKESHAIADYHSNKKTSRLGVGLAFAAGIEGYITPNFFLKGEWRYELMLQYPTIGIAYSF